MINSEVKRLYTEASKNKAFNTQFKKADKGYYKPSFLLSHAEMAAFALVYEGWLIARGEFDESKYS